MVQITKKYVKGKTSIEDKTTGSVVESEENIAEVNAEGPAANVGIQLGYTKNLGNYEAAKVGVSVNMPCDPNEEACDAAFAFVEGWANKKMEEIISQL